MKISKILNSKKGFTLIELIIVIVVIGILAGMALPKFIGVQRDAKVAAMIRDIDTLEKAVVIYNNDTDKLPIVEDSARATINVSDTLQETLNTFADDANQLKILDLEELKNYTSKTKYGHEKNENDIYLYSMKTGHIYYQAGLKDGKGITRHTYDSGSNASIVDEDGKVITTLKDVKFGEQLLTGNRNTIDGEPSNTFKGLVKSGVSIKAEVNGVDVSSDVTLGGNGVTRDAASASEEYQEFSLPANLDPLKVNKLRVKMPETNESVIFLLDFKQDQLLAAPDVDVDVSKTPYELIVNYPEGVDVKETQYIIDNKDTTTTKPDLTDLMDGKTHSIQVRYLTTDDKLSEWANVSFSYSDGNTKPDVPGTPEEKPDKYAFAWNKTKETLFDRAFLTEDNILYQYDSTNATVTPIFEDVKDIHSFYVLLENGELYRYDGINKPTLIATNVKEFPVVENNTSSSSGAVYALTNDNKLLGLNVSWGSGLSINAWSRDNPVTLLEDTSKYKEIIYHPLGIAMIEKGTNDLYFKGLSEYHKVTSFTQSPIVIARNVTSATINYSSSTAPRITYIKDGHLYLERDGNGLLNANPDATVTDPNAIILFTEALSYNNGCYFVENGTIYSASKIYGNYFRKEIFTGFKQLLSKSEDGTWFLSEDNSIYCIDRSYTSEQLQPRLVASNVTNLKFIGSRFLQTVTYTDSNGRPATLELRDKTSYPVTYSADTKIIASYEQGTLYEENGKTYFKSYNAPVELPDVTVVIPEETE